MFRRPLAIRPRFLLIFLLICAVYWVVAAKTGLSPLVPESTFNQRVGECAAIWVLLCTSYIGVMMLCRRPYPERGRVWPIAMIPVLAGLWGSATEARDHWFEFSDPLLGHMYLTMTFIPLVMGVMGGALPLCLAWPWRRMHPPGFCFVCGYDLRGSFSGRCSECGIQIAADGSTRPAVHPRWLPELLLFETAASRDAGWKTCKQRLDRRLAYWLAGGGWFGAVILFAMYRYFEKRLGWWAWAVLAIAGLMAMGSQWLTHRMARRGVRRILLESGIRVCLHCGEDLREVQDEVCPKCHRPVPITASAAPKPASDSRR